MRDRLLYTVVTTVAAAVVSINFAQVTGDPASPDVGHVIALAVIFVLSYLWAPRLRRARRQPQPPPLRV
jgi:heme A synthase